MSLSLPVLRMLPGRLRKRLIRKLYLNIHPKRLAKLHALALLLILGLGFVIHSAALWTYVQSGFYSEINASGRQRMLSVRILLTAREWNETGSPAAHKMLGESIDQFEQSHRTLSRSENLTENLQGLYFQARAGQSLDDLVSRYVSDARQIHAGKPGSAASKVSSLSEMEMIELLPRLENVVAAFEVAAAQRDEFFTTLHTFALLAAVVVVMGEALFIFIPISTAVRRTVTKLERQAARLSSSRQEILARQLVIEQAKELATRQAMHDTLSGLPNRRYLNEALNERVSRTRRYGGAIAVLQLDLDGFKQVNDFSGHAAGDQMIVDVANILKKQIRTSDFVARMGGDEFTILLDQISSPRDVEIVASRIISEISKPFVYKDMSHNIGVSIGIAIYSGEEIETEELLIRSDLALYAAKKNGRNRYEHFCNSQMNSIIERKEKSDLLMAAVEERAFFPVFQAQVDVRTLDVVGVEALARWRHPDGRILAPNEFLSLAEEMDIIAAIDGVILEQALEARADWEMAGVQIPKVSVNVSGQRLKDKTLLSKLSESNIPKNIVSFELLESILLEEIDETVSENIKGLADLGIDLELDDFGSGHASIVGLYNLRPKRLKIDRRLIGLVDEELGRRLVRGIVEIGRSLNIEIVAEGIETLEQFKIVQSLGCDCAQGYYFCKPLSSEEFLEVVTSQHWRDVA